MINPLSYFSRPAEQRRNLAESIVDKPELRDTPTTKYLQDSGSKENLLPTTHHPKAESRKYMYTGILDVSKPHTTRLAYMRVLRYI
jgi:hypothetical protein